ncbi:MAG: UDP-2,3-diacylglucosamine diphosphatase [Bacteroidales bacterium]
MKLNPGEKIYIVSDSHLGVPSHAASLHREKLLVSWLDMASKDAAEIYLLGDIFDFWFEYHTVVPKGFVRLLGKLAEISDQGVPVYFFTGNHDMWAFDYFEKELGVKMIREPIERVYNSRKFLIGHGDGLGPGDASYKFLKRVFTNKVCQKLFSWLHPGIGTSLALYFSRKSRLANGPVDEIFLGEEKERLIIYCKELLQQKHIDFFIFGHRHLPMDIQVGPESRYINTGDWVSQFSYVVFDGEQLRLTSFQQPEEASQV